MAGARRVGEGVYAHFPGRMGAQELAAGDLHSSSGEEKVVSKQTRHKVHFAYDAMKSSCHDAEIGGSHL